MTTSATVLFVDDDASVLEIGAILIRRLGHTVLTASLPGEALSISRTIPTKLDCLVTDIALPGMDGFEVASQIQAQHADVRVLYVTGDPESGKRLRRQKLTWLAKPFTSQEFESAIKHLLQDGKSSAAHGI